MGSGVGHRSPSLRFAPWGGRRDRRVDARAILAERFAPGEIDEAEYAARLEVLSQ